MPARLWLVVPACLLLPIVAAVVTGTQPEALFQFPPPLDIPRAYPRFSGRAAAAVLIAAGCVAASWILAGVRRTQTAAVFAASSRCGRPFPWWGWFALAWTALWWVLAWNRFPWIAPVQRYTFTPLWLGFIVTMNAVAYARAGTCLATRAPGRWAMLFVASAAFWWVFEWLNRFVQNWHYPIGTHIGAGEYLIHATVCFSTVLPAVTAVREALDTVPALQAKLAAGPRWPWLRGRHVTAVVLIAAGAAGLAATAPWPRYAYPALWAAPLLLGVGLAMSAGADGWWNGVARGEWREAGSWALAGIICGGFWELWNMYSLAKWIYTVPFLDRWHVFEMPVFGYLGYLPFGIECGLAVGVLGTWRTPPAHLAERPSPASRSPGAGEGLQRTQRS